MKIIILLKKIYDIIRSILLMDKWNGEVIDYIDPLLDPLYKDEVLPYDINKSAGSYLGDILIELANILGANIYYDKTKENKYVSSKYAMLHNLVTSQEIIEVIGENNCDCIEYYLLLYYELGLL